MVSDFFYPNMGGVETHLYQVSQCLLKRGHKVIVITHAYGKRKGVRFMTHGLKVYYAPIVPFYNSSSLPTVIFSLPLFRQILIRERIDLVHCHQAFSTLGHEAMLNSSVMGVRTCFTDHSLFGFRDASSIHMNKVLKLVLSDVSHVVCVSNTSKENTVLRASLDPRNVSVIPNAIDATQFVPNPSARSINTITVVVVSRLTYRKGIDLLVAVLPELCRRCPNVNFVIGGDGPKRLDLEEMREKHQLHDRIELLGSLPHSEVPKILNRGHIFLNCSLTEAFCIAIVEAASCGLLVVSTRVGGVPEVLPDDMVELAAPEPDDLVRAVLSALARVNDVSPWQFHERVKTMYNWNYVARRTELVYDRILRTEPVSFIERLRRYYGCGSWAGKLWCLIISFIFFVWKISQIVHPRHEIDIAPEWPRQSSVTESLASADQSERATAGERATDKNAKKKKKPKQKQKKKTTTLKKKKKKKKRGERIE
jgi:phosphatidylinositol N-acetylglucosaminyltransferase subunit A